MNNRKLVGILASVVVAALVIAGLMAVGSPADARKARIDQERRNRISQLHYLLAAHVNEEESLPGSLDDVDDDVIRRNGFAFDARKDPETDEFFEYRRLSAREYEVCASFHLSSEDLQGREFGPFPGSVSHDAGRNCFEREVTDDDVESSAPPRFDPPGVVRPVPLEPEERPETPESPEATESPGGSGPATPEAGATGSPPQEV